MAAPIDLELKKVEIQRVAILICSHLFSSVLTCSHLFSVFNSSYAFSELQVKMIDTQQKVKLADLQIDQLTRVQKHAKLTHAEITTLPDNTRLYEGVGRMFILQSKEEINNQLMDKQKTADEKIKELEKKVYLERSVKEAEDNIREMLLSRRAH
ncbi:prefoldin subunit 1 isoform X2 [Trachinotus anak]|uniref:prefoldin subunit 1 isoform X2 n=1 Tax=Trachinotus anak TaxID=443729 RepID=UPI0039F1740A